MYFFSDKSSDIEDSQSDEGSFQKRPCKRPLDSPPGDFPTGKDEPMHSPVSLTSSEANSVLYSSYPARPSNVDTLRYIFPFYSERTLQLTLEECNNNILQAVLQMSQDILSFRAPFTDTDQLSKVRSIAMLFSSSIDKSSNARPDCCASPYCPKQMAYDWARQRTTTPRNQLPDLATSKSVDVDYSTPYSSPRFVPEKRARFIDLPPNIGNRY